MKQKQVAGDVNRSSHPRYLVAVCLPHDPKSTLNCDLERSNYFVVDGGAKCAEQSPLFFLKLESFQSCDVLEIQHLAVLVIEDHFVPTHDDCLGTLGWCLILLCRGDFNLHILLSFVLFNHFVHNLLQSDQLLTVSGISASFNLVLFSICVPFFLDGYKLRNRNRAHSLLIVLICQICPK